MINKFWLSKKFIMNKGNSFGVFLSSISILGISIGLASIIVSSSVMNGFSKQLLDRVLVLSPHIELTTENPIVITDNNDVFKDTYKYATFTTAIQTPATKSVKGVVAITMDNPERTGVKIYTDKESGISKSNPDISIGMGVNLALTQGLEIGDSIKVLYQSKKNKPKLLNANISYLYEAGIHLYDDKTIIIDYKDQNKYWPQEVYTQAFTAKDPMNMTLEIKEIHKQLEEKGLACTDSGCITTWKQKNKNLIKAFDSKKVTINTVLSIIILMSVFNLMSSLMMTVKDKTASISMMKTFGAKSTDIVSVFMLMGLTIGIVGSLTGLIFGLGISYYIEPIVATIENVLNFKILDPNVFYVSTIKSEISMKESMLFFGLTISLAILATIYPSIKASKTQISTQIKK